MADLNDKAPSGLGCVWIHLNEPESDRDEVR